MEDLAPVMGGVGSMIVIAWVIVGYFKYRRNKQIAELQAQMQNRLMEKFGSSQEMMQYLESEAGQRFLESATLERGNPFSRILSSIQAGTILTLAGLAVLAFRSQVTDPEEALGFVFLGLIALALGLGFLLSSAASFVLSKKWGLINGQRPDRSGR